MITYMSFSSSNTLAFFLKFFTGNVETIDANDRNRVHNTVNLISKVAEEYGIPQCKVIKIDTNIEGPTVENNRIADQIRRNTGR